MPTVLLLGGGFTLEKLAAALNPGSFVITSRSPEKCAAWKARGWTARELDIGSLPDIESLVPEFPSLSAIVDSVPPFPGRDPACGVRNVCAALASSSLRRAVYLSTTGVFGVNDGSWVDEETPAKPSNPKAEARLHCENVYRASGLRTLVLRLPAIYGYERGIVESLRQGTYRLIDNGENWTNRIHVDDLVTIIAKVLEADPEEPLLCVGDEEPARACDVVQFVCSKLGLPWPTSISAQEAREKGLYTMLSNQRVKSTRMRSVLGVTLKYPSYREGLLDAMTRLQGGVIASGAKQSPRGG
jgi:dTDP-4-dehydrorhamnose reductase